MNTNKISVSVFTKPKKLRDSKKDFLIAFLKAKTIYKQLEYLRGGG